jgi:hypothetical protein
MSFFEGNSNAGAVRYHLRRIIRRRAARRRLRTINAAAVCSSRLPGEFHLLTRWSTAHDAGGIKLYTHRLMLMLTIR